MAWEGGCDRGVWPESWVWLLDELRLYLQAVGVVMVVGRAVGVVMVVGGGVGVVMVVGRAVGVVMVVGRAVGVVTMLLSLYMQTSRCI